MKKLTALFLSLVWVFTFVACSNSADNEQETQSTSETQTTAAAIKPSGKDNTADSGKTLVVYFSASGNTEGAAGYIAKATNGELFELEPKDAYTDEDLNWRDENSRVNYEHDNESARDIELVSSTCG